MTRLFIAKVALSVFLGIAAMAASAQAQPAATETTAAMLAGFKADPTTFMAGIVAAKGDVAAVVAKLISGDPGVITAAESGKPSLMATASKSIPDQEAAFVKGVAEAAKGFVQLNQRDTFTAIQNAVVAQFDTKFQADFANAISDIRTTALGGAGGGGGGPVNGIQTGGANSQLQNLASELVKNSGPGAPQVGVGSASGGSGSEGNSGTSTNTTTTTTILITRTINVSASASALNSF